MLNCLLWLWPFLCTCLVNGQSYPPVGDPEDLARMLNDLKVKLDRMVPTPKAVKPNDRQLYHHAVWDEPVTDFYHPYTFNVLDGNRENLVVESIFEESRLPALDGLPPVALTLVEVAGVRVLAWASKGLVTVQWTTIRGDVVWSKALHGVKDLEHLTIRNPSTKDTELYLLVLRSELDQRVTVLKINLQNPNITITQEFPVKPDVSVIRLVDLPQTKRHLIVAARYLSTESPSPSMSSSEVLEATFVSDKLFFYKLDSIPTSGAVDVEPFTINGITYIAVADSHCAYSGVFVFDADVNDFHLYQRLHLPNATDFEYFSVGFRHFVAGIGLHKAVIFEWEGERLVFLQEFSIEPPSVWPDHRRWHSLPIGFPDQALLLLVRSHRSVVLVTWLKTEGRFVLLDVSACISWARYQDSMGSNINELLPSHRDMFSAHMECSWAGDQCIGVTEKPQVDSRLYTLELEPGGIRPAPSPGFAFWRKEKLPGLSCLALNDGIGFGRITSYRVQDIARVVIPFGKFTAVVAVISRRVRTEHFSKRASWMQSLGAAQEKIEAQELRLHQLNSTDKPSIVVTVNGNERIEEPIHFRTDVNVSHILDVVNLTFSKSQGTAKMGQYEGALADLDRLIEEILGRLEDAVPIHKPVAVDTLNFLNVTVDGHILSKNGAEIEKINGVDLSDLIRNAVSARSEIPVYGRKVFPGPVHINGNMVVNGLVAGKDFPEDILTTNTAQELTGIWKFDHPVTVEEAIVDGQLNGVDMNNLVVINPAHPTANVTYPARISFLDNLVVEGDIVARSIDGIDLRALAPAVVTLKDHQIITAPKVFAQNVHVIGDVNLHKTIDGFFLPLLDASVVKSDQQADITGHKIFKDNVFMDGSIFIHGRVMDYVIPDDFVLNNTTATISGRKTFKKLTVKQNVFVDQFVDGIPLHVLVTLNTDQTIPDLKIFTGGVEFRNLEVEGELDGMTIEELRKLHSPDYQHPTAPTVFDHVIVAGDLSSIESINGFPVAELRADTVLKGETNVVLHSAKTFKENAVVRGTVKDMGRINHLDLRTDFVKADAPQLVTGKKIFGHLVTFTKGLDIQGLLDRVNVTEFGLTKVTLTTQQEIHGTKVFTDGINVNGPSNVGLVDNVAIPEQLLLPQNPKPITGTKKFLNGLHGTKLFVKMLNLRGKLNGVNWEVFASKRVTLSSPQNISTTLNFAENVTVHGNLHVNGNINTVNLHNLVADAMRKSVKQTVTGPKTVLGMVQAQSIVKTRHGLDGVDLAKLNRIIVPINNGVISNPYSFHDIRAGTELNVKGRLGALDLDHLVKDSVMKVGPRQSIIAPKTFNEGLRVEGNMNIERVNKLDIINSILSRSRPQMITGAYELIGEVVVEKDFVVNGNINNLNLVEFDQQVMKTDKTTSTNGMTFEDHLKVDSNLDVATTVNGVNLPELVEDAVLKTGPAKITGKKTFTGELAVNMNVDVQRNVNGFSLSEFASDVVFVTGEQIITGPKHFHHMSLDGDLMVGNNLIIKGRIEGVSLPDLFKNAVLLHDQIPIHGHKIFTAPVQAQNLVALDALNLIRFPRDVVTINGPQAVNGLKHFHHVVVETNVIGERVNGHNLAATAGDTLLNVEDQSVKGIKVLQKPTIFRSPVEVYGTTCGLNFRDEVVTLDGPQQITGEKVIHHMTIANSAQIDKLNGNNLGPLTELWRIREEESPAAEHHFMGRTKFNHPVSIMATPVSVEGLKNDILELDALQKRLLGGLDVARKHCLGYSEIMNPLGHAAVKLHHFDDLQQLEVLSSTGLTSWTIGNQLHMIAGHDGRECQHDTLYVWDNNAGLFLKTGPFGTPGKSGHWHPFVYKGQQFLAVSDSSSCGSGSKIWQYNNEILRYEVHCHLNISASQMATLRSGEDFYLVVAHVDAKSEVLLMDINNKCSIRRHWNVFPESSLVTVIEPLGLIVFGNTLRIFSEVYRLSQQEFVLTQRLETPGIKDVISASANQHYIILNRKQYPSKWTKPMDMVQIYMVSNAHTDPLALVKEIPSEMLREVLDLDTFPFGPQNEPYLAILHKKTGVMITPLLGLLTYDGVKLPMPQAKKMHVFTRQGRPYIVLNQVDPRQNAHVYRGNLQGSNVKNVIKC